ncbi:hypothetical protein PQG02_30375 [Nostoc sp. UHCC 0926]|uniref:hypothetical protein n=1 Tax=Nostoc sp. TaxID=1180 RepID=UPI0027A986A4|nr:hypothetical protein PQG02_30375 [Nostoc sp. UHCC 0926]
MVVIKSNLDAFALDCWVYPKSIGLAGAIAMVFGQIKSMIFITFTCPKGLRAMTHYALLKQFIQLYLKNLKNQIHLQQSLQV